MDRRTLLKTAGSAAGLAALGTTAQTLAHGMKKEDGLNIDNASLYKTDGTFDEEKGKDAIEALCRHHGYPLFPGFRDNLWVSDYGTGEFTRLGLAAYIFVNNVEDHYMMLDLFILPGQMLPEHWHVEGEGNPAKMEGWLIRWGSSYVVGIGEPNLPPEIKIPQCHSNGTAETKHAVLANPGMFVPLAKVYSKHWQYGGPDGAIVTEVANVHTTSAVRHADKKLNDYFLSGS